MLAVNAVREFRVRPLRTVLTLAGIAVTTAMLADMLMLGRGIRRSFIELFQSPGYELRLAPKGTLPFDTEATVPAFATLRDSVERVPGVERVAPVLAAAISVERESSAEGPVQADAEGSVQALALGMDPDDQSLYRLTAGQTPARDHLLVDPEVKAALGLETGSGVQLVSAGGASAWGARLAARVSGTAEFVFAARGDLEVVMRLEDLQLLTSQSDQVSFAMIRVAEGYDADSVRAAIAAVASRVEIVAMAGMSERVDQRLSYFRQIALILGTVSLVVATLLVGTIAAVSVTERLGLIAAMRAIGVSRRRLVGGLVAESAALCAVGGAIGIVLSVVLAGYLESILSDFPGLPVAVRFFVVGADSLVTAFVLLLASGTIAGMIPALNATRLEVSAILHKEAP